MTYTHAVSDALISYLAGTTSASAFLNTVGIDETDGNLAILSTLASEYANAPCDADGATVAQQDYMDSLVNRAIAALR